MSFLDILRELERLTRPPKLGHDVDVTVAEYDPSTDTSRCDCGHQVRYCECPDSTFDLDDVVAQLAQLTYFVEDIRNLLASMIPDVPAAVEDPTPLPAAGFTFADLAEAERVIGFYADEMTMSGSSERGRLLALAARLGDESHPDPNP